MIEMKTTELIGPALDWAVAKCVYEKVPTTLPFDEFLKGSVHGNWGLTESEWGEIQALKDGYSPSTNWGQGGPLIAEYRVSLEDIGIGWIATSRCCTSAAGSMTPQASDSLLVAACRAIVCASIGDTVQIPSELIQ